MLLTFDYVTGENAFRKSSALAAKQPRFYRSRTATKEYLMENVGKLYQYLAPLLFVVALIIHLRQLGLALVNRSFTFKPLFGLVLAGSVLSILAILTFVQLTLWQVSRPLHVAYPVILLYIALTLLPFKPDQMRRTS